MPIILINFLWWHILLDIFRDQINVINLQYCTTSFVLIIQKIQIIWYLHVSQGHYINEKHKLKLKQYELT